MYICTYMLLLSLSVSREKRGGGGLTTMWRGVTAMTTAVDPSASPLSSTTCERGPVVKTIKRTVSRIMVHIKSTTRHIDRSKRSQYFNSGAIYIQFCKVTEYTLLWAKRHLRLSKRGRWHFSNFSKSLSPSNSVLENKIRYQCHRNSEPTFVKQF